MKKQTGKQTKGGTNQNPFASQGSPNADRGGQKQDPSRPGVGKPGQQPDTGQGAIDFHQSNHGRRGR